MFGSVKVYAFIEWLAFKFRLPTQDRSHNDDIRCVFATLVLINVSFLMPFGEGCVLGLG
ncbi:hypothetical protein HanRHA438_Chr13g0585081 [Helianthus annuus]|nr:hypothetical protein HanRHA438_Chr13g0585081 [Helianthus annuus]